MKRCLNTNKTHILLFFSLMVYSFFSCTPLKNQKYLQADKETKTDTFIVDKEVYRFNKGDNLYIDIITSNTEFRSFFSSPRTERATGSMNPSYLHLTSFQIDENGYIHVPFIEPIMAYNKTVKEVQYEVEKALSVYVTDITVSVKLVNFNITLLGEVSRPGQYFIPNDGINLFEAISLAGDLTVYGNRKNIKILRILKNGDYQMHEIDITQADVITDMFFTLQPNDIIYVEPLRTKPFALGAISVSTILSTITTILVIISLIK